jgi:uncharacterized HAD superfamily protein
MFLVKEYAKKYNDDVIKRNLVMNEEAASLSNLFGWTDGEEKSFCKKYLDEISSNVPIKTGAIEIIKKLREEKNEIYIISARNNKDYDDPYAVTKDFFDKNNIPYDHLIVGCMEKDTFCSENTIEIMLDDDPKNIESVSKYIPVIVLDAIHNKNCIGNNVIRCSDWYEVYDKIKEIEYSRMGI